MHARSLRAEGTNRPRWAQNNNTMKTILIVICTFLLFAGFDPTPKNEPVAPAHVCGDTTHKTCDGNCECDGYCNE